MADVKIANLTAKTTWADTDIIIVEDSSDTKKMTVATLKSLIGVNPTFTGAMTHGTKKVIPVSMSIPTSDATNHLIATLTMATYNACVVDINIGGLQGGAGSYGIHRRLTVSHDGSLVVTVLQNEFWGGPGIDKRGDLTTVNNDTNKTVSFYFKSSNNSGVDCKGELVAVGAYVSFI